MQLRVYNNELQYRWLDSAGYDVSMWIHFLLTDLNRRSAYEVAVENGFTGSEEERLQSITPDLSPYITRVEVLKIVDDKIHSSAPDLSPYVTRVETRKLVEAKFQSLTSVKIAKCDKISEIDTELQQFRDFTQYDQKIQNDAIFNLENRITILESKTEYMLNYSFDMLGLAGAITRIRKSNLSELWRAENERKYLYNYRHNRRIFRSFA